ncbi:hypothetical protein PIB30_108857, partial [Stylosanthes scabra]|nr:hypothetical protein [Stylosanthes scabra]
SCVSRTSTSTTDRLGAGQSIQDGETLVSVGGSFELGFFKPGTSTNRYLGVWYRDASTNPTVVWVANRERPHHTTSGVLKFSEKGTLQLLNDANTSVSVWSSNISSSVKASNNLVLQLLNSGNLVVKYGQDAIEDNFLWQSFDYPSDTLMPGMKVGLNLVTGLDMFLSCWKSSDDPAMGEYSLKIKPSGYPQLVQTKGSVVVTRAGPWNGISFSGYPSPMVIYSIDFVVNDEEMYYQYKMIDTSLFSIYKTITFGSGKVLVWTSQTRTQVKITPTDIADQCEIYTFCGSNSICNMDGNAPTCECLKAYVSKVPKQWNMSDWSSGCVRKSALDCNSTDGFLTYRNMKLPDTSSSMYNKAMNIEECRESCLKNCSCTAYANMDIRNGGSG